MKNKIAILSLMLSLTGCVTKVENTMVLEGCDASIEASLMKDLATNDTALDKQALLDLLPGSTIYQNGSDIVQVGFYSENHTMTGNVWGSWEDHIDKGSWMISDRGQFCNQWAGLWSKGDGQNCYDVYLGEEEDQYIMISDSAQNVNALEADVEMITITPGDIDEFE